MCVNSLSTESGKNFEWYRITQFKKSQNLLKTHESWKLEEIVDFLEINFDFDISFAK